MVKIGRLFKGYQINEEEIDRELPELKKGPQSIWKRRSGGISMAGYVVDTQAIVKFPAGKKVINERIHQIMEMADEGENIIVIPSVVIFEIGYLHEKGRMPVSLKDIERILDTALNYVEEPLSFGLIR